MLNSVDVQYHFILLPEEGVMVRIPGAGDKSADNTALIVSVSVLLTSMYYLHLKL